VPADNPPLSARPEQTGLPVGYAGYQEPARAAQPPIAPQGPPTNVPPSFIAGFSGASSGPGANPSVPSAQPIRPPEPEANTTTTSTRGINVQPPTPSRSLPSYKSQDSGAGTDEPIKTKGRSKILSSGYEGQDDTDDYVPATADRYAVAPRPSSPIPKIIGVVAVLLLLMKAWAFKDFVSTDWGKIAWLVTDQFVTMGIIICLAVLAFTRKD